MNKFNKEIFKQKEKEDEKKRLIKEFGKDMAKGLVQGAGITIGVIATTAVIGAIGSAIVKSSK